MIFRGFWASIAGLLLGFSGCLHTNSIDDDSVLSPDEGLVSGDGIYIYQIYNLHQITNSSEQELPRDVLLDGGFVAWRAGGNGNPVRIHAINLHNSSTTLFDYPENLIPSGFYIKDRNLLTSGHPYQGNKAFTENRTVLIWDVAQNTTEKGNYKFENPTFIRGLSSNWIIFMQMGEGNSPDALLGLNRESGNITTIHVAESADQYFGNIILNNDVIFYNIFAGSNSACSHNLSSSETLCPANGLRKGAFVESVTDDYVYYRVGISRDISHLYVMDRSTGLSHQLTGGNSTFFSPSAAGEWVIYQHMEMVPTYSVEGQPETLYYVVGNITLAARNMETMGMETLIPQNNDISVAVWGTDGHFIALIGTTSEHSPNIRYPGKQVYWMELPDIEN